MNPLSSVWNCSIEYSENVHLASITGHITVRIKKLYKEIIFPVFCLDFEHCVLLIGKDINFECLEAV